jgi:hypothetical protein
VSQPRGHKPSGEESRSSEEAWTLSQRVKRLESLEENQPPSEGMNIQMMKVRDEKAIAVVACSELQMNDMEIKLGRVMAK